MKIRRAFWIVGMIVLAGACSKEDYGIEYQDDYPNAFADNWIAFEFQGGDLEGDFLAPYDMVTSLDPNQQGALILDKIYDADIRIRTYYADSSFSVLYGENLETVSDHNYGIHYVSVDGYITTNPVLTDLMYSASNSYYNHADITREHIEDVLFMRAGFYDSLHVRVDTVLVVAYRKSGFEDVDYQQ